MVGVKAVRERSSEREGLGAVNTVMVLKTPLMRPANSQMEQRGVPRTSEFTLNTCNASQHQRCDYCYHIKVIFIIHFSLWEYFQKVHGNRMKR